MAQRAMSSQIKKMDDVFKDVVFLINQVFEIEFKTSKLTEKNSIHRNIQKLKEYFDERVCKTCSLKYENPIGQDYDQTRTDVEASIAGEGVENLTIIDVIKPIIRLEDKATGTTSIIQKGIVIVQSKDIKEEKQA